MDTCEPTKGTPEGPGHSCPPPAHVAGGSTAATAPPPPPYLSSGNTLYHIPASPQGPVYYSGYIAGYPPGQNVVVTTQPGVIVAPVPSYQPDYLGYSIFTMLCCCMPIGIAALIFSIKTREANSRGEAGLARSNSSTARILNHVALGVGLLVTISWMGYSIFVIVTLSGYYGTIVNSSFDSNHYYG
ncbi:proline rich transmembrane protein 1B-like isoform X1 [Pleurodeles waltl]|uniref:proline rich transmembrane protein 1B-like isoform X1 n=1 Tax=Pleurodeles waltl TaxID=8319 RepID=UPI0037094AB1